MLDTPIPAVHNGIVTSRTGSIVLVVLHSSASLVIASATDALHHLHQTYLFSHSSSQLAVMLSTQACDCLSPCLLPVAGHAWGWGLFCSICRFCFSPIVTV